MIIVSALREATQRETFRGDAPQGRMDAMGWQEILLVSERYKSFDEAICSYRQSNYVNASLEPVND
ncbi:aldehyde dehydrogenase [Anopheles sinensis]|uniref:Aldehyde dehydrogenase n=1 Tax=Anopheles sinensis TaxID=74873 RepID=A0A084WKC7_ANOSI|nr:aldehyde dehydrogenase [Anopheles sinensis]